MKHLPPATVEIIRGPLVESRHGVDIVVADAAGKLVSVQGEADRLVFPRSTVKAFQALPLIESGAADRFGFEPRHVALACASHIGDDVHVEGARGMLAAAGLEPRCLECGAQLPSRPSDLKRLFVSGGDAEPIRNNCSGKHSGFLAFAAHSGMPTEGYVGYNHPVQRVIAETMTQVTGAVHGPDNWGIDGCSIPTYSIPLSSLAIAFARFGVGVNSDGARGKAMDRIRSACLAHPEMVGGMDDPTTEIMKALGGRAFVKSGAEGIFIAAVPEKGLGIALKAHDGAGRASDVAMAGTLASLLELSPDEARAMARFAHPPVLTRKGEVAGEMRLAR